MKRSERRSLLCRYLWMLCAGLCGVIVLLALLTWLVLQHHSAKIEQQAAAQRPDAAIFSDDSEPLAAQNPDALAWRAQPVLMRTRRPPVALPKVLQDTPPEVVIRKEPPQPFTALLTSIVIRGDTRLAFFRTAEQQNLKLYEGDEYQGWRLQKVAPDAVTLENDGQVVHLELRNYGSPASQK